MAIFWCQLTAPKSHGSLGAGTKGCVQMNETGSSIVSLLSLRQSSYCLKSLMYKQQPSEPGEMRAVSNSHVTKAAHIRYVLQRLLGQVQVVVGLDGGALPPLGTLLQPLQAHHIALLLHMGSELVVLLSCHEVRHILGPVLVHLQAPHNLLRRHLQSVWSWLLLGETEVAWKQLLAYGA